MSNKIYKNEYSMSFSEDYVFPDGLLNEKNLILESSESENSIIQINDLNKKENISLQFFSEISPIAYNAKDCKSNLINNKNINDKEQKFITADSQISSLVNIEKKNASYLNEISDNNLYYRDNLNINQIKSSSLSLDKKASDNNINLTEKPSLISHNSTADYNKNCKKEIVNGLLKINNNNNNKKDQKIIQQEKNNQKLKAKKSNKDNKAKSENLKIYVENIKKNKELNIAKLIIQEENVKESRKNKSSQKINKKESNKNKENELKNNSLQPDDDSLYSKLIKKAEISISETKVEDISFGNFLNLLQKGMYSCSFFSSDVYFQDFKDELEKLNISLKISKFNLEDKQREFKEKLKTYSDDKKENIFFYYYVSINLILQSLVKNKINLRINRKFDFNLVKEPSVELEHIPLNINQTKVDFISPITTKKAHNKPNAKLLKESKINHESNLLKQPTKINEHSSQIYFPLNEPERLLNEKNQIGINDGLQNESKCVFKSFNDVDKNNFDVNNEIIQAKNNLVFMPYTKNTTNCFSACNIPNRNIANFHKQIVENNRYLIAPRQQMIYNANAFYRKDLCDNSNKIGILPIYHPLYYFNTNNSISNINRSLNNQIGFNPVMPSFNGSFANHANLPQSHNNINQTNQLKNQPLNYLSNVKINNLNQISLYNQTSKDTNHTETSLQNSYKNNSHKTIKDLTSRKEIDEKKDVNRINNNEMLNLKNETYFIKSYNEIENPKVKEKCNLKLSKLDDIITSVDHRKNYRSNFHLINQENKENESYLSNKLLGNKRNYNNNNNSINNSKISKNNNSKKIKHS